MLGRHLGRHTEAEAAYRKAIELEPKNSYAWSHLADILMRPFDRNSEAEVACRKAIELDPKNAQNWNDLGFVLAWKLNRADEAEVAHRKATELNPQDAYSWCMLGAVQTRLERFDDAEVAYRKAIELNANYACAWHWFGQLLERHRERFAEAEAAYRKAIELDSKLSYAFMDLAELLTKLHGKQAEARQYLIKAMQLNPQLYSGRSLFNEISSEYLDDWKAVLPTMASWCLANPKATEVFDFAVDGFLKLARLTKPAEALALLDALPDPAPFETLRDAFRAHANRDHLNRLAPERRVLAIELLKRLSEPEESDPATKAPSDG